MKANNLNHIAQLLNTTISLFQSLRTCGYVTLPKKVNNKYELSESWIDNVQMWLAIPGKEKEKMTLMKRYGTDNRGGLYGKFKTECDKAGNEYVKNLQRKQDDRDLEFAERYKTVERFNPTMME